MSSCQKKIKKRKWWTAKNGRPSGGPRRQVPTDVDGVGGVATPPKGSEPLSGRAALAPPPPSSSSASASRRWRRQTADTATGQDDDDVGQAKRFSFVFRLGFEKPFRYRRRQTTRADSRDAVSTSKNERYRRRRDAPKKKPTSETRNSVGKNQKKKRKKSITIESKKEPRTERKRTPLLPAWRTRSAAALAMRPRPNRPRPPLIDSMAWPASSNETRRRRRRRRLPQSQHPLDIRPTRQNNFVLSF